MCHRPTTAHKQNGAKHNTQDPAMGEGKEKRIARLRAKEPGKIQELKRPGTGNM